MAWVRIIPCKTTLLDIRTLSQDLNKIGTISRSSVTIQMDSRMQQLEDQMQAISNLSMLIMVVIEHHSPECSTITDLK